MIWILYIRIWSRKTFYYVITHIRPLPTTARYHPRLRQLVVKLVSEKSYWILKFVLLILALLLSKTNITLPLYPHVITVHQRLFWGLGGRFRVIYGALDASLWSSSLETLSSKPMTTWSIWLWWKASVMESLTLLSSSRSTRWQVEVVAILHQSKY